MSDAIEQSTQTYTQQLYQYLQDLKTAYIEYTDILTEITAANKGEDAESFEIPEEKEPAIKDYAKIMRQAVNLTFLEYKTLVKTKKAKESKELEEAKKSIDEEKKYFMSEEKAEEYVLQLNAYVLEQIMPNMFKKATDVYDANKKK